jgi:hypothetical protein
MIQLPFRFVYGQLRNEPKAKKRIAKSLSRLWRRHFCVINRHKVSTLLSPLNSQNRSIKFTCEEEDDGSLFFLDVRVTRRESRNRKPTKTQRCIPITSCHPMEQKMSAFHCMLHLSLSRENFEKKVAYIKETAGSMDILKPPLTGLCRNIFSNLRSRKSLHCHPSAKRLLSEQA